MCLASEEKPKDLAAVTIGSLAPTLHEQFLHMKMAIYTETYTACMQLLSITSTAGAANGSKVNSGLPATVTMDVVLSTCMHPGSRFL
jgi:hypothetical protein